MAILDVCFANPAIFINIPSRRRHSWLRINVQNYAAIRNTQRAHWRPPHGRHTWKHACARKETGAATLALDRATLTTPVLNAETC